MKRAERHHLKENELAHLARVAVEGLEAQRRHIVVGLVAAVIVGAAVVGYLLWRGSVQERAGTLLAEALVVEEARVGPPPAPGQPETGLRFPTERERYEAAAAKFKTVADQYPATDAGLFARYRQGTMQMALGSHKEAVATYQQVVDRVGDGLYGQMARLGIAEAHARAGALEEAINTYKELSQLKDGPLPIDGILMQLGRAYREAGKPADAQQTFTRVVDEFPDSPFTGEARRELDSLKKT